MPSTARIKLIAVGFLTACIVQAASVFAIGGIVFNSQKPVVEIFLLFLKSIPSLLINGFLYGLLLALAAAVPAALLIWLTEHFSLRRLVYYLVASLALVFLFFGGDLLRWPTDPWYGRNAAEQHASVLFSGLAYWMIAGRSAGSTDGLESHRFTSHLVTIFLAFMAACMAVATVWGTSSAMSSWDSVPIKPSMASAFALAAGYGIYFTSIFGFLFLLPVVAAESFRIRSVLFYGFAGVAIFLFDAILSYWLLKKADALEFSWLGLMAVWGVAFGLTYWAIAGRHAGQWRHDEVQ